MEVLGMPNGACEKHGPRLSVNGVPTCIRCAADAERASRPAAPTVLVEDPGHDAMSNIKALPESPRPKLSVPSIVAQMSLSESIEAALKIMKALPMPKDIKQFKTISKIIASMEKILEEGKDNG